MNIILGHGVEEGSGALRVKVRDDNVVVVQPELLDLFLAKLGDFGVLFVEVFDQGRAFCPTSFRGLFVLLLYRTPVDQFVVL